RSPHEEHRSRCERKIVDHRRGVKLRRLLAGERVCDETTIVATELGDPGAVAFERALAEERRLNVRRLGLLRFVAVSAFLALFLVIPVALISFDDRIIFFTAVVGGAFEAFPRRQTGAPAGTIVSSVLLMGTTAAFCSYASRRTITLVSDISAEHRRLERMGRY